MMKYVDREMLPIVKPIRLGLLSVIDCTLCRECRRPLRTQSTAPPTRLGRATPIEIYIIIDDAGAIQHNAAGLCVYSCVSQYALKFHFDVSSIANTRARVRFLRAIIR